MNNKNHIFYTMDLLQINKMKILKVIRKIISRNNRIQNYDIIK